MGADFEPAMMSPHSQDAEEALLGSIIIYPDAFMQVKVFLKKDDFFILRNAWVWDAIDRLIERGDNVDNLTLAQELRAMGRLADCGGDAYITYLTMNAVSSMNTEDYGRIVERAALRRRMLKSSSEIAELARDEDKDINVVVVEGQRSYQQNVLERMVNTQERSMSQIILAAIDNVETAFNTDAENDHGQDIEYPVHVLRKNLGVIPKGALIIFSGRTGTGKSRFSFQTALYNIKKNRRSIIFTTEMTEEEVIDVLVEMQSQTGFSVGKKRTRQLESAHYKEYVELSTELNDCPLEIVRCNGWTVEQITARLLRGNGHYQLAVVDLINRLATSQIKMTADSDHKVYGHIAYTLKNTAQDDRVNCAMIAIAQTNRDGAKGGGQGNENLSGSDRIGQEADGVIILRRPALHDEKLKNDPAMKIHIAKYRGVACMGYTYDTLFHPTRGTVQDKTKSTVPGGVHEPVVNWADEEE